VATVSALQIAPVKGLALVQRDEVSLERIGVPENRRFYLVDDRGRRYGLLRDARLALVAPDYDAATEQLALRFPDGSVVADTVTVDGEVVTDFYGRPVTGRVVRGPWDEALSEYVGKRLRLVQPAPGAAVDRGDVGPVSVLSDASLDELARRAGVDRVDGRRFRMLVHVAGCEPHEEDSWLGGRLRVGDAVVYLREQVARCAITTQNPSTAEVDLDTLREIKAYRGARGRKYIDFGVYGDVVEPGRVRVGDAVEPVAAA
jgi:uncharacterized protein YcbX